MDDRNSQQTESLSLVPTHALLVLLHKAKGNLLTTEELIKRLLDYLKFRRAELLLKYVDIDSTVEDDLCYMEKLCLVEKILAEGNKIEGWRITSLGMIMAIAICNNPCPKN